MGTVFSVDCSDRRRVDPGLLGNESLASGPGVPGWAAAAAAAATDAAGFQVDGAVMVGWALVSEQETWREHVSFQFHCGG